MKPLASLIHRYIHRQDPDGTRRRLSGLWQNWAAIVGDDIAALAKPLGHHKTTLLVGVEDHMLMQELSFYSPALLEQANAFLDMNFFDKVHIDLIGSHVPLDTLPLQKKKAAPQSYAPPGHLGSLLHTLKENSPLGRCYRACVDFYTGQDTSAPEKKEKNSQGGESDE